MKHQNIYNRLRRIEGQVRGVEDMLAKDLSEKEILVQLEAIKSSVSSAISTLIADQVEKNKNTDNTFLITEDWLKLIIRTIKKD